MRDVLLIEACLTTVSSLYIGAGADREAGGSRDLPVLRNALDDMPIVPGSSLRGRMVTLLKAHCPDAIAGEETAAQALAILFGTPGKRSALSFWDCQPEVPWAYEHRAAGLALTHWRSEQAPMPDKRLVFRRRELISAGVRFRFRLTLLAAQAENAGLPTQAALDRVRQGLLLMEQHGIGGATVRGFGRVAFSDVTVSAARGGTVPPLRMP